MRMGTGKFLSFSLIALILLMVVACGTAATPTTAPPTIPSKPETGSTGPAPTAGPTATPTVAPTVTPLSTQVTSAKDSMTLVIDSEPAVINPLGTVGSGFASAVMKDNLVDPLTWQSGDDLRIVPTTATVSW